ncbi:MAG: dihydropteroate synthase [Candidatus Eremiobacteraeota bacterium]|nr:dihydropteroate synthase [Candidatus Eremiobacteraeota bacterium]
MVRGVRLPWGERTYVMGIVNITPDSFSGDGVVAPDDALNRALAQVRRGSDIVDVGGESTRPGHERVAEAREIERVVPAIRAVRERLPHAIVSVDTYKPAVARAACEAGADAINSVWGMPDPLLDVALEFGTPVVIMHNQEHAEYAGSMLDEVLAFLSEAAERAVKRGLSHAHVILDPGVGFAKTPEQNVAVLHGLDRVVSLGFPTLLGASRKSTIGKLTGREPHERTYGTAATTALAIAAGIDVVRVHDVAETRDVVAVSDAVVRDWRPEGWTR